MSDIKYYKISKSHKAAKLQIDFWKNNHIGLHYDIVIFDEWSFIRIDYSLSKQIFVCPPFEESSEEEYNTMKPYSLLA